MKFRVLLILLSLTALSALAQSKIKVACVGNSITEGRRIEEGKRYPDQLENLLGDKYEVRNYGIGGRTLLRKGDYPYWNEEKYKEVLAWSPDIIVIKLGTNDSKPQNWNSKDDYMTDYLDFIKSFKKIPGKQKIYVCLPIPVFKDEWGISERVVAEEVIPLTKKVAKKAHVKLIDLYTPMIGKGDLVPDGVHPMEEGSGIIAKVVYESIK